MDDEDKKEPVIAPVENDDEDVDENMSLFIYGNIRIRDVETGEILVNKRF